MDVGRILLVDDEPAILTTTARALERGGFVVEGASSGREALARLAAASPFELIMADLVMPGMSGLAFLERATELAPESVLVAYTAALQLVDAVDLVNKARVFQVIEKPCDADDLRASLHECLAQQRELILERQVVAAAASEGIERLLQTLAAREVSVYPPTLIAVRLIAGVAQERRIRDRRWALELHVLRAAVPDLLERDGPAFLAPTTLALFAQAPALSAAGSLLVEETYQRAQHVWHACRDRAVLEGLLARTPGPRVWLPAAPATD